MTIRKCEKCLGPGPTLWDESCQRMLCCKCHSTPNDEFFVRQVDEVVHPNGHCTCYGEGWCTWCKDNRKMGELVDALAAYAHSAWSGWMKYLFSKMVTCSCRAEGPGAAIPPEVAARWERQMKTEYKDLPEKEQISDQDEAHKIIHIMSSCLGGNLAIFEHANWIRGITDCIKTLDNKIRFLQSGAPSMIPSMIPKPGVVETLEEVRVLFLAMRNRGTYSSHSTLMENSDGK